MTLIMMCVALFINIILITGIILFFLSEKRKRREMAKGIVQLEKSIHGQICTNMGMDLCANPSETVSVTSLQTNAKVINSGPDYCTEGFECDLSSFAKKTFDASFLIADGRE